MFTQKMNRQLSSWLNTPPNVGPMTDEMPHTLATYPCTLARSRSV